MVHGSLIALLFMKDVIFFVNMGSHLFSLFIFYLNFLKNNHGRVGILLTIVVVFKGKIIISFKCSKIKT